MKRRKLLLGLGSLAAGGAATIGTGAFSETKVRRNADAVIEPDGSSPFMNLMAPNTLTNGEYAAVVGDQLTLQFDTDADVAGEGLSADSLTFFDSIFRIRNDGANPVRVYIEDSNLGNMEDKVYFYRGSTPSQSLEPEGDPQPYADSGDRPIGVGQQLNVGMAFDLRGVDSAQSLFDDTPIRVIGYDNDEGNNTVP